MVVFMLILFNGSKEEDMLPETSCGEDEVYQSESSTIEA